MTTIPDPAGREAVRLLNADLTPAFTRYAWPVNKDHPAVITVAKLLMNPPAPMVDPDEEAAERMLEVLGLQKNADRLRWATEQMRKEFAARKEAGEAGR